jgi:hypothetical protein
MARLLIFDVHVADVAARLTFLSVHRAAGVESMRPQSTKETVGRAASSTDSHRKRQGGIRISVDAIYGPREPYPPGTRL